MKNIPFTHQDIKKCHVGFTPSGTFPNRRRRKESLKTQKAEYGRFVHHYQPVFNKKQNKVILIPHFSTPTLTSGGTDVTKGKHEFNIMGKVGTTKPNQFRKVKSHSHTNTHKKTKA